MTKLIIILLLLLRLFTGGNAQNTFPPPVTQSFENVVSIELLDMHNCHSGSENNTEILLYTLPEDEMDEFWTKFIALEFRGYFNDPATQYGILAVRITYADGCIDIFGADMSSHTDSDGTLEFSSAHVDDRDDLRNLFAQYVDERILPPSDYLFLN